MAQCNCYQVLNNNSEPGTFAYTDCITGDLFTDITVAPYSSVYTCSKLPIYSQSGTLQLNINSNQEPCNYECSCKCYSVENTSTTSEFGYFNYRSCVDGEFTQTETEVGYPGSGQPSLLYFCVQSYGTGNPPGILDASPQGANLVFTQLNDFFNCDYCNNINYCYSWTVNDGDILPSLDISYTNTDGDLIEQVEVLTNILYVVNLDGTYTYYLCSRTEPEFYEGGVITVPTFTVEMGGTCNSDLECNPTIPYTVWLVSDCCDEKPDGLMELPVGLLPNQVVGSSTDNNCYKLVGIPEGGTANLDWDGSVFPVGQCDECQNDNGYLCQQEPPTPTPTSTKTPTPTPTITSTPTLTPTPTSQSSIIYFQRCCNIGQYLGIYNYNGPIISENSYYSITVGSNTFCVKTVSSAPSTVVLYDYESIDLSGYDNCEDCIDEHPCPPPPTQEIMGYRNECGVITIFPMNIECVSTSPSRTDSYDGYVSVSITGGTPPYKYTWEGINIGNNNHAPAIDEVPVGDYTVTVVDYWGDFTATTTCVLTAKTDCNFVGTIKEFTPPTPTPTMTMTPTPSSIPSLCNCRYGTVTISPVDVDASDDGFVYVSYQGCDGVCYCLTVDGNNAKPYTSGTFTNDICIKKTTTTNSFDVSLFIIVGGEEQLLPVNGDSFVTLGGCCQLPPTPTPTPTMTKTPTNTPTVTPTTPGFNLQCSVETADITFLYGSLIAGETTIFVSNDGTKLYLISDGGQRIKQASIAIGNDISSTISYVNQSPIIPGGLNKFKGVFLSPNGLKVFVLSQGTLNTPADIIEFSLSIAWDITTMSTTPTSTLAYPSPVYVARMFTFNSTGTRIYSTYSQTSTSHYSIYWDLSSPYTLSTAGSPVTNDITSTIIGGPSGTLYLENGINFLYIPVSFNSFSVYQNGTTNSNWLYNSILCGWRVPMSSNYSYVYDIDRSGSLAPFTWTLTQHLTGL